MARKCPILLNMKYGFPDYMLYPLCNFYALRDVDKIFDLKILKGYFSLKNCR